MALLTGIEPLPEDLAGAPHGRSSAEGLSCIDSTQCGAARKDHGANEKTSIEKWTSVVE